MKRARTIALVVLLAVIVVAAFFALGPREPVHQGKRLSAWLRDLDNSSLKVDAHNRAVEAVRKIGADGVPILIEMLNSSDTWLKRKLMELVGKQSRMQFHFSTAQERRSRAFRAIEVLGPIAREAIPTLIELLNDKETMTSAMVSLERIGPEAILPLTRALTNENPFVRGAAIVSLGVLSSNAQAAVPALVQRLESDIDNRVRGNAADALGNIGKEPEMAVPALTKHLKDSDPNIRAMATRALGKFGKQALPAVPKLLKTMEDEDHFVREAAVTALKEIDPEAAAKTGIK